MAKIYYEQDCNISMLEGKTVAVIGYGGMASYHHLRIEKPEQIQFKAAFDLSAARLEKAKKDGLIDQFIYGSISATYLADILDSL